MRILVTGSAGHVGSKLAVNLYNKGYEVTGADMSKPIDMSFQQIVADLSRWDEVKDLGVYDVIYHIAGHSAGDLSIINYEDDIRGNILTTANIIKLAQLTGTRQIVYTSSMAVYGDQPTYPVREDATPMPRVYYGANKLASEYYLKIASTENLNTCSLRLFNTYGPGQDINNLNQGMASIFLGELIEKKHFEMRGSPDRFRDFLYIDDAVDGLVSCLGNNGINGEVINLASGTKSTLGELLELIRSKLPFETTVSYTAPSDFDLSGMHGDIEKAKRLLNFNPKVGLSEGLDKMVKWALGEKK